MRDSDAPRQNNFKRAIGAALATETRREEEKYSLYFDDEQRSIGRQGPPSR